MIKPIFNSIHKSSLTPGKNIPRLQRAFVVHIVYQWILPIQQLNMPTLDSLEFHRSIFTISDYGFVAFAFSTGKNLTQGIRTITLLQLPVHWRYGSCSWGPYAISLPSNSYRFKNFHISILEFHLLVQNDSVSSILILSYVSQIHI